MVVEAAPPGSIEFAGKLQLRQYGHFLQDFSDESRKLTDDFLKSIYAELHDEPLRLELLPCERTSLIELVACENQILNKVLRVLCYLCSEVEELRREAITRFYPALLLYGEGEKEDDGPEEDKDDDSSTPKLEGYSVILMGRMLTCLQEVSTFIDRCYEVTRNIVHQLCQLYHPKPEKTLNMDGVHFEVVFEALGRLLKILLTMDEIIKKHPLLLEHWQSYMRAVKLVHHNPEKFRTTYDNLKALQNILQKLDAQLMSGYILQNCAEQPFDTAEITVARNQKFEEEMAHCIHSLFEQIDQRLGDPSETTERSRLVSICALCVLYIFIFRNVDKKSFKGIWQTYKKVPAFPLLADIIWSPTEFLMSKFPNLDKAIDRKAVQAFKVAKAAFLVQKTQALSRDSQACIVQVSNWLVQMRNIPEWSQSIHKDLERRAALLIEGVQNAYSVSRLATTTIGLHVAEEKPMTKMCVQSVFRLLELTKAIEATFERHWLIIAESCAHIVQHYVVLLLKVLGGGKARLQADVKRFSERRLDILSALQLAENVLAGPGTMERIVVLKCALSIAANSKSFTADELTKINNIMYRLETVISLTQRVRDATDCSYLYWHRSLLGVYFADLIEEPALASGAKCIFRALNDCRSVLVAVRHVDAQVATENFEKDVFEFAQQNLLDKICNAVETDLRLSIHTHLHLNDRNPFVVGAVKDYRHLISLPPMHIGSTSIDIKVYVERYLERTFYNLTTIALHDWRTYAEMRLLSKQKYGLQLVEAHLPSQQLEQGLDVLEVMRNIQIFVAKYMYNLNNQIFVERASNNKHLNTINIKHIANSIRTHGTGIMNTTVNFTYQFLRKKFYVFSQFLYDEQIKSRLIKDIRFFKEHKDELQKQYPFDRAEKFHRGIRRLGVSPDGQTYLDQFRNLVTQIGNALGYVRMIRSGGLQCCAQAIEFVPDLEDIDAFEQLCTQEALSPETCQAANRLDAVVTQLVESFAEGTEYFKLLVDVFATEFRSVKNVHLKNFYVIVPPMTVNYVEYMIACKDKITKKTTVGGAFTDDGFAMGVAYVLQLLDQNRDFNLLHWFESVRAKYMGQRRQLLDQQKRALTEHDEKLQQTITLSLKRLDQYEKEFELLNFSLTSARIFFRTSDNRTEKTVATRSVDDEEANDTASEA